MAEWTSQAADAIERAVGTVRDRAVVPAQRAGRVVVFGLFAAFVTITAAFLLFIGVFRLLAVALPVWAAWLALGALLVVVGALCWRLRIPREARS
jgi:hypothetical protein